jgi:hypothetical protein
MSPPCSTTSRSSFDAKLEKLDIPRTAAGGTRHVPTALGAPGWPAASGRCRLRHRAVRTPAAALGSPCWPVATCRWACCARRANGNMYDQLHKAELVYYLDTQPGAVRPHRFGRHPVLLRPTGRCAGCQPPSAAAARLVGVHGRGACRAMRMLDHRILPQGRYAHADRYLRRCLADAGFAARSTSSAGHAEDGSRASGGRAGW